MRRERRTATASTARARTLELKDLAPGFYHYRVIATNSHGTAESAEQTFSILAPTSGLPDGRACEMVTPPDKHGAPVEALTREGGLIVAARDGGALTYVANGAISEVHRQPQL